MKRQKNEVTAIVYQRPYEVKLECRLCDYENEYSYDDFCGSADQPPDWNGAKFTCEGCGEEMEVDDQDWDN